MVGTVPSCLRHRKWECGSKIWKTFRMMRNWKGSKNGLGKRRHKGISLIWKSQRNQRLEVGGIRCRSGARITAKQKGGISQGGNCYSPPYGRSARSNGTLPLLDSPKKILTQMINSVWIGLSKLWVTLKVKIWYSLRINNGLQNIIFTIIRQSRSMTRRTGVTLTTWISDRRYVRLMRGSQKTVI